MMSALDGLEGVVAAETVLSDVDGLAGRLIIRGHDLGEIAGRWRFEDVVSLLWSGFLDVPSDVDAALGRARVEAYAEVSGLEALSERSPVEALRALLARLPDGDDLDTALRFTAAPAVFTAACLRVRQGLAPIAPDPRLSHAADALSMLRGAAPDAAEVRALDAYLVTVCDHGLNASTFTARVVASTRAGLGSAVIAGLCALKGPLHGGAPGPVIEMLDEIGEASRAEAWLNDALDRGDRLMGFGHRVYKVRDPRADALKVAVSELMRARRATGQGRLELAEAVEKAALAVLAARKPARSLQTNVEFYTALLLEALGYPADAMTCVFAMGRVAGWIAHAREQEAGGRLIRPASRYVGPTPRPALVA